MFWNTNETPIADTSGANFGARRSGLYTTRSTDQFNAAQNAAAKGKIANSPSATDHPDVADSNPNHSIKVSANIEPSMNKSPWAKLIKPIMPYTIV